MVQHWNKQKTQPMLTDMLPSPPSMEQDFQCFQREIFPVALRCSTVWSHWCLALKDTVAYDRKRRESSGGRLLLSWSYLLVSLAIANFYSSHYGNKITLFWRGHSFTRRKYRQQVLHPGTSETWAILRLLLTLINMIYVLLQGQVVFFLPRWSAWIPELLLPQTALSFHGSLLPIRPSMSA